MKRPILYIKNGCPWCDEAMSWFQQHAVDLEVRDVSKSSASMQRMIEVSGQSLTPTFEYEDLIVADFSIDEFLDELAEHPEIRRKLGLSDYIDEE